MSYSYIFIPVHSNISNSQAAIQRK